MKTTAYFDAIRTRPDRSLIKEAWIERAITSPCRAQVRPGHDGGGVVDVGHGTVRSRHSWWGTTQTLPIDAGEAGVTGGEPWQELIVILTHVGAGLGLIVAWSLLVVGFLRHASGPAINDA